MPKIKLLLSVIILSLIINYQLTINNSVYAVTPATSYPTCDLCGWCNRETNPTPPANWDSCKDCLYESDGTTPKGGNYYTVFGCMTAKPEYFVKSLLSIVFGVAGGIAFLSVLYGSGLMLTSAGNPEQIQSGKEIVTSSLVGILLIIFSVFLLRVVGFEILKIPGFG